MTGSPESIHSGSFPLSIFFVQQVGNAPNLFRRNLQSLDLFAQLRLLGLLLTQHFMDVLHVEPPVANVGFASGMVNEGRPTKGYGRNPRKTAQIGVLCSRSQDGQAPETERVLFSGTYWGWFNLSYGFLLTFSKNTLRIIDFRPTLGLQYRPEARVR